MPSAGRRHIQSGGHGTRVHADVVSFAGGVGGNRVNGRWRLQRRVGDKGARALATDEHPLVLKALVDGADGVGIDVQRLGKIPQPRQALARGESAIPDASAQRPGELHTKGNLGAAIEDQLVKQSHTREISSLAGRLTVF